MSDFLKHECGIALLRLKKPLAYFHDRYGTALYGFNKLFLYHLYEQKYYELV